MFDVQILKDFKLQQELYLKAKWQENVDYNFLCYVCKLFFLMISWSPGSLMSLFKGFLEKY